MKDTTKQHTEKQVDENPPWFNTWKNFYKFLVLFLVLQIIVYYLITIYYQ